MKTFHLERADAALCYHDLPGPGLPLLFLHGLGCASSCDYPGVASDPVLLDHRRILVDLLGSGYSDRPHGFGYTVADHARCIRELAEGLGLARFALFGHSMGGAIAIAAARLCEPKVAALILGEPNLDPGGGVFSRAITACSERDYVASGHDQQVRAALGDGNALWAASMRLALPEAIHRQAASLVAGSAPTWREELEAYSFPRTVIFGERSLPDPDTEWLPARGVSIQVVPETGHSMAWENPAGLARAIRAALDGAKPGPRLPPSGSIRPARLDDAPALAGLCGELGYPAAAEEIAARLPDLLAAATHGLFVAEAEGAVVGWIHVREDLSLESGAHAELAGLVVASVQRSRGLGAQLVTAVEAWASERGLARIRVRSRVQREAAHRFYRRLGYADLKTQAVFEKGL